MKMSISAHERLLDEWSKHRLHAEKSFVRDGPISWEKWSTVPRRVLFLAKEAYGMTTSSECWDLTELVREEWQGPKYKFWWTLGYWAYGIQRLRKEKIPASPFYEELWDEVTESVLATSIVNIKKSDGRSSSNADDLRRYVRCDSKRILDQVECLDPHVVVCCNTWAIVKNDLWPHTEPISERVYRVNGMLVLDYWHPAAFFPDVMGYYAAIALLHQALWASPTLRQR